jgi:hypothetical protein
MGSYGLPGTGSVPNTAPTSAPSGHPHTVSRARKTITTISSRKSEPRRWWVSQVRGRFPIHIRGFVVVSLDLIFERFLVG